MGYDRHDAVALKAADARALLNSTLPFVLQRMTAAQVEQVQKVLDAQVVNPEIMKRANELYRKSVQAQSGNLVMRDQRMVDRAYKIASTVISVTEQDKHVRLDYHKLLTADALAPTTDNPDEIAYLASIKNTIEQRGIWLRFDQQLVPVPGEGGSWRYDPRTFVAWLSLGYGGDTIPTQNGQIDRKALLGTTMLGAGYWEHVHRGPIQVELERQMAGLRYDIEEGMTEHARLRHRKAEAPIVSAISDTVGGADLPDISIWETPNALLTKAYELNSHGRIGGVQPTLVMAAVMARNCANLLAEYAEKSGEGAGSVIKVLKVARTAGKVAEVGLAVTGVAGMARAGLGAVAGETAAADAAVDEAAEKLLKDYVRRNPEIAADLNKVKVIPGPKGTVLGNIKGGHSSGTIGDGWSRW